MPDKAPDETAVCRAFSICDIEIRKSVSLCDVHDGRTVGDRLVVLA